jgi:hypothetical protein
MLFVFFIACLSPNSFSFNGSFLGQSAKFDVSGLSKLPDIVLTPIVVSTLAVMFVTIFYSMTLREEKTSISVFFEDYARRHYRRSIHDK